MQQALKLVPTHIPNNVYHIRTRKRISNDPLKSYAAQPIKDPLILEAVKNKLLLSSPKYGLRNYMIFRLGINIGLRCGDLLQIRLKDIWDFNTSTIKQPTIILEEKTLKKRTLYFARDLQEELTSYIFTLPYLPDTPLFPSRRKKQKQVITVKDNTGCLSRKSYWKILNTIAHDLGVEHLSTHTIRKTFGYSVYTKYNGTLIENKYSALDVVQKLLNHGSSNHTLRYIGVDNEIEQSILQNMSL